jgi:hypothetical protein
MAYLGATPGEGDPVDCQSVELGCGPHRGSVMAKRTCKAKTKAGKPCRGHPLEGTDFCIAHSDEITKGKLGFGGAQPGSGQPRKPRPHELSQRLMEENLAAVERPYWKALGYDIVAKGDGSGLELVELEHGGAREVAAFKGEVYVSDVEDLAAQMTAAEKLKDRIYGKPKQEVQVAGDLPIHLEVTGAQLISDRDARKHTGAARRRVGAARAELARRARTSH